MKNLKAKTIAAIVIIAVLAGAWFIGGVADISLAGVGLASTPSDNTTEVNPNTPDSGNEDDSTETALPETPVVPSSVVNQPELQLFGTEHPEMRAAVEPENTASGDASFTVTLEVRVDTILNNMQLLHRDKHELVPADGVIWPRTEVVVYQGESVFNVLQREMRSNRIHLASRFTPIYNSAYVEAINNLYEFDVGPLSGWMYSVNGWFPNFGASRYLLSPGDDIRWLYTVDLGRDLGVSWDHEGE